MYCVQHTLAGELSPSQRDCELPPSLRHHNLRWLQGPPLRAEREEKKTNPNFILHHGDGDRGYDFWINNYSWSLLRFSYKKKPTLLAKM